MKHLFLLFCMLPFCASAQTDDTVVTRAQLIAAQAGKLDTSKAAAVELSTKAGMVTKRGFIQVDTFSVPATGVLDLGPYLTARGYTSMKFLGAIPFRQAGTATTGSQFMVTAWTPTTVTLVVTQQNTAVVSVAGISVLSGLPLIAAPVGAVKAYISFVAY